MTAPPPFTTLRRYVAVKKVERCALCGIHLAADHGHLLETERAANGLFLRALLDPLPAPRDCRV